MKRTLSMTAALIAVLGAPAAATATMRENPLRCESLQMRCDGQWDDCVARCDELANRKSGHAAQGSTWTELGCEQKCQQRHDDKMAGIDSNPPCPVVCGPDPMLCDARLMHNDADEKFCESHCASRAAQHDDFDQQKCTTACQKAHCDSVAAIETSCVCQGVTLPTLDPPCN